MSLKNLKKYRTALVDVKPKVRAPKSAKRKKPANARHSKEDPNWISPEDDVLGPERAMWQSLGLEIDLDPYSSEIANTIVRAKRFFTEKGDGFGQPHVCEAMHVNHPGGTTKRAWKKLMDEVAAGNTKRACWVGFSVEQLGLLADPLEGPRRVDNPLPHPQNFSIVMMRSRIDFIKESTLQAGGRPGHSNYICVIGVPRATVDWHWQTLGRVFHGSLAGIVGDDLRKALVTWPG